MAETKTQDPDVLKRIEEDSNSVSSAANLLYHLSQHLHAPRLAQGLQDAGRDLRRLSDLVRAEAEGRPFYVSIGSWEKPAPSAPQGVEALAQDLERLARNVGHLTARSPVVALIETLAHASRLSAWCALAIRRHQETKN